MAHRAAVVQSHPGALTCQQQSGTYLIDYFFVITPKSSFLIPVEAMAVVDDRENRGRCPHPRIQPIQ